MTTTIITFKSYLTDKVKTITLTPTSNLSGYMKATNGKVYRIDDSGCYPLLNVVCQGKCNTYDRVVGRYPVMTHSKTEAPKMNTRTISPRIVTEKERALINSLYSELARKRDAIQAVRDNVETRETAVVTLNINPDSNIVDGLGDVNALLSDAFQHVDKAMQNLLKIWNDYC